MQKNNSHNAKFIDYLKAWPQYLLPHYLLCNLMHRVTRSRLILWKNVFTRWFIHQYRVDMSEAAQPDINQYECFNAFFTRELKPNAREINQQPGAIISPVDGTISQMGVINDQQIFQAKGREFSLTTLLGGNEQWANQFSGGQFATLYLSPKDYHRIHMPISGNLQAMTYIPGRLFSVNPATTRAVPNLFARNERVVCLFQNDELGPFIMVLVGALFVGSMETIWHGVITPPHGAKLHIWEYDKNSEFETALAKNAEMGRFNMGSTVILLFPAKTSQWLNKLESGQKIKMGQQLGEVKKNLA